MKIEISEDEFLMVLTALNTHIQRVDDASHAAWARGEKDASLASDAVANKYDELRRQLNNGRRSS